MSYKVYILKSKKIKRYYIGHTQNIGKRLKEHNSGKTKSTKAYRPWEKIYEENFSNKRDTYAREMEIKSYKGGIVFKKIIKNTEA